MRTGQVFSSLVFLLSIACGNGTPSGDATITSDRSSPVDQTAPLDLTVSPDFGFPFDPMVLSDGAVPLDDVAPLDLPPSPDAIPPPDLASSPDLTAAPDGPPSQLQDLTPPSDLTMTPDLTTPPDLVPARDLTAFTCTDHIKNGNETDVDCGGSCPNGCAAGKGCGVVADCAAGLTCVNMVCQTAVVSGGLVLYLDAGDKTSYPGSGNVWKDLGGKGYDATLAATQFTSELGGGLFVPQTSGLKIVVPAAPYWSFDPSSAGNTLEVWWKKGSDVSHGGSIIGTYPSNGGTWQIFQNSVGYSTTEPKAMMLWANGNMPQYWWSGSSHDLNEVAMMTVIQNGQTFDFYKNGIYVSSQTRSSFAESGARVLTLGTNSMGVEQAAVTFYTVRWYNRPLSAGEVAQNYGAQKKRFGQ